ncbi:SAM-dependent methyltransferase [Methanobrevibacter sp. 87.7]|uniref:SAM-dependent methyltransferase n=1 Tax=Methanobrevibacter sp. 87.7 TaxID=387957 RepID=UPI000B50EFC0|nr:SAM-dependent methyltransferase [Methanobrevibacter sp. 87.7]OWT33746.1 SAM-dependent methyltransferase [Methanobrevibacter sp. 87.7]
MKFKTTSYHSHLIKDTERLSAFYEAISDYAIKNGINEYRLIKDDNDNLINKVVYDLGCGSGILSYFASLYFNSVVGFEKNHRIAKYASENLESFDNTLILEADVLELEGLEKGNLIICEMLDTALIDEEEVPVLNHFREYMEEDCTLIPKAVNNFAEPISTDINNISWEDPDSNFNYEIIGDKIRYSEINLEEYIDEEFNQILEFKINKNSIFNGIKITTVTFLGDNIVCGPTPMFNPPLFIPTEKLDVKSGDTIKIRLKYIMGGGIESIETKIIR